MFLDSLAQKAGIFCPKLLDPQGFGRIAPSSRWYAPCSRSPMSCENPLELNTAKAAALPKARCSSPNPGHWLRIGTRSRSFLRGAGLLIAVACSALQAEERAAYLDAADHGPALEAEAAPNHPAAADPWSVQALGSAARPESADELSGSQRGIFSHAMEQRNGAGLDTEFMLLRAKMPSRYAYDSWAGFHSGYGQFFPDDTIGRSRIGGVGIHNRDWFYVKLSFKF
jgi:hypothetical protein